MNVLDLKDGSVRSVGRQGRGPLEFSGTSVIQGMRGDSAVIQDYSLRRLTVVSVRSLKGRVVTSAALDKGAGSR